MENIVLQLLNCTAHISTMVHVTRLYTIHKSFHLDIHCLFGNNSCNSILHQNNINFHESIKFFSADLLPFTIIIN